MKKYKFSFTLTELMICVTIIGVIMAMSVQAIKAVNSSYTALTYFAFKNVKTIVRSMWEINSQAPLVDNDGNEQIDKDVIIKKCKLNAGSLWTFGIMQPDVPADYTDPSDIPNCNTENDEFDDLASYTVRANPINFCERVSAMANTSGEIRCDAGDLRTVTVSGNVPRINIGSINLPNFTTTNGQRYYISQRVVNTAIVPDFGFRLIAIDLNGQRRPNIVSPRTNEFTDSDASKFPDIITFMIIDNGVVFPLGVAGNNKPAGNKWVNYLNSRLKAYDFDYSGAVGAQDAMCMTEEGQRACTYRQDYLPNDHSNAQEGLVSSYRQMFCMSGKEEREFYPDYCDGLNAVNVCIGTPYDSPNVYDECYADPIKPLFRFNL